MEPHTITCFVGVQMMLGILAVTSHFELDLCAFFLGVFQVVVSSSIW